MGGLVTLGVLWYVISIHLEVSRETRVLAALNDAQHEPNTAEKKAPRTTSNQDSREAPALDPPAANGIDQLKPTQTWPSTCDRQAVRVVYPQASAARAEHMASIMTRIDACARVVPAVMRENVTKETVDGITRAAYQGSTIIYTKGKSLPKGNVPNAATHMRMIQAASVAEGVDDSGWFLFFEDDAQLHATVSAAYPQPKDVQALLAWSFRAAEALQVSLISYAVCTVPGRSKCEAVTEIPQLQNEHPQIQLGRCEGDFRCAVAYALPKKRATQLVEAYAQLNAGETQSCTSKLWGGGKCSVDPMAFNNYFKKCEKRVKVEECTSLVVGMNLIAPTARHNDHLGIFIQEKGKNMTRHYDV